MLLTTYRHSFRSPDINYPKKHKPGEEPCVCPITISENRKNGSCPPIDTSSKAMNAADVDCSILLQPESASTHQVCNLDTTERFLGNMNSVYPDLYEKIKSLPSDELNRLLANDANKTVYMVDFCKSKGYGDGLFESQKQQKRNVCGDETKTGWVSKVSPEEFKCYGHFRPHKYKPERNVEQQRKNNEKNFLASEYMDKFSRTGCIILKSNLHNHKKCPGPENCQHPLKHCPVIY